MIYVAVCFKQENCHFLEQECLIKEFRAQNMFTKFFCRIALLNIADFYLKISNALFRKGRSKC